MKIDLNLFTVFDAIYTEGNLTKAASVLNLTQPAVSHALTKLRHNFDDQLFIRKANKMVPTPIADNMIEDVRNALNQLQVTLQNSRSFLPLTAKKHFKLALHDSLEAYFLPILMNRITHASPNSSLSCSRVRRNELENKLSSGEIDLAIDILLAVNNNIFHRQLRKDKLVVLASNKHPEIDSQINLDRYLKQKHVLVSSRTSGPGLEDFELSRLGLKRSVGLRCQHFFSACKVIEDSHMLLTLPETVADIFSQELNVNIFSLPIELPLIDVHLYWHKSADKDPANKWLRDEIFKIS